jgi:DNA polymerase I
MPAKERLFLIDGSGYIFRAYYAIRSLTTSKGLPSNALYGFTSMLLKLLREEKPDHVAVVFDAGRKTFRNELYADYKANRAEPPEDLIPQFPYFRKIVQALNIACLEMPNYEADDVIGTIAKQLEKKNLETVIITADKDLMQLVDQKITLWDTMRDRKVGVKEVEARFMAGPDKVTDIFGLCGDTSDNIPGVPGVGEKTAIKLIQEYGSLDAVLSNTDTMKGKLKERLEQNRDQALLSKKLATIVTEAPIDFDFEDFAAKEPLQEDLQELFEELEFRSFLKELAPQKTLDEKNYQLVTSEQDLKKVIAQCLKADHVAFDLETTGLDVLTAEIVGIGLCCSEADIYYIPVGHSYEGAPSQLKLKTVVMALAPLFEKKRQDLWAQNVKYDAPILKRYGLLALPIHRDTMVASYLLHPEERHNLSALAQKYLKHKMVEYEEVVGKGKKQKCFSEVEVELALHYAGEDVDATFRIAQILNEELKKEKLEPLYDDLEGPLIQVLMDMERIGVLVDDQFLKKLSQDYDQRLKAMEGEIYQQAGREFNIKSPKQLGTVLFDELQLPVIRKTKTGHSTDVEVLTELRSHHEIAAHVLEYRSLSKLQSTYVEALPQLIHPQTGRIHTSFNQTIAATGRLSSSTPNLQNIPIRTEEGKRIREAFIAEPGFTLLSVDYSQIELRLLAHISEDPLLVQAFHENEDIHRQTAAKIFGIPSQDVTDAMRSTGKTINFGVVYGQTAHGLSQQLGISMGEAGDYINRFYERFEGVKKCKETILAEVHKTQRAKTLMGRRRNFPDINSRNMNIRNLAERMAFNTIFQGSAADLIKKAMIAIARQFQQNSLKSRMILQVHDELVFEVFEDEKTQVEKMVVDRMENVMSLKVPIRADVGWGSNWAEAH